MSPSNNPFSIPIGTSDPVDLCQGLPLSRVLGTARAGATGAARSQNLFDVGITVLFTRINLTAYYSWGFGVCGPAIGFLSRNVDVLRENVANQGKGKLTLTFNEGLEMQAGLFVGAYVGLGLSLSVQLYLPRPWYKVWSFAWRDAFAVNASYNIDLLALMVLLIQFLLSKKSVSSFLADDQNRLVSVLPDLKATFAMVDSVGSKDEVEKDLTATPQLTLPFNLVNYFAPLKALNDKLANIGGEISAGPSLNLQFPVRFNFTGFTVEGGLEHGQSADYGNVDYSGKQLTTTGARFDTDVLPRRLTSHVKYATAFSLGLSVHFKVSVAKLINLEVNSVSLDLTYILTGIRERDRGFDVPNQVSTGVAGSCVLTPNMTLAFAGPNGNRGTLTTGQTVTGTVRLPGFSSSKDTDVTIEIEPRVTGFPSTATIKAGSNSASFQYIFQNQCVVSGNPNNPAEAAPPSAVTPLQTYTVRASLPSDSNPNGCTDYEVQMPLNIEERFVRCQLARNLGAPGPAPPWDNLAGVTIYADADGSKPNQLKGAILSLWFPYQNGEREDPVPITFTLLNENRQPHASSNVVITGLPGSLTLKPSGRVTRAPAGTPTGAGFLLTWNSKGKSTGYYNRFYLIVNAGCRYGQTEVWLNVWNWS